MKSTGFYRALCVSLLALTIFFSSCDKYGRDELDSICTVAFNADPFSSKNASVSNSEVEKDTDVMVSGFDIVSGDSSISFLFFDMSFFKPELIIESARLRLREFDLDEPVTIELYAVKNDWSDSSLHWGQLPDLELYSTQEVKGEHGYVFANVSKIVADWQMDPENNYGLCIQVANGKGLKFASPTSIGIDFRPQLKCYLTAGADLCACYQLNKDIPVDTTTTYKDSTLYILVDSTLYFSSSGIIIDDAMVWSAEPDLAHGSNWYNYAGFDNLTGTLHEARSFIRFDWVLPVEAEGIVSAELKLFVDEDESTVIPDDIKISNLNAAWDKDVVNWTNRPTSSNEELLPLNALGESMVFSITDIVKSWYSISSFGIEISVPNMGKEEGIYFYSADYPDSSLHPELFITYNYYQEQIVQVPVKE